jgi:hemolysin-activating ACP:hemolysin acyltransferase
MIKDILSLMSQSRLHKKWYVEDIFNIILPPIESGQCIVVRENDKVVGFGTWAYMSNASLDAFLNGTRKIGPQDFNNGHNLVLVDIVSPYGHGTKIAFKIRHRLLELGHWGKKIKYVRYYNGKRVQKESVL